MSYLALLLAGLFLPLFPLSMLFNLFYARLRDPVMRGLAVMELGRCTFVARPDHRSATAGGRRS